MPNYVDNKKFHEEMTSFITSSREAKMEDRPIPKINDYIGKCIYDIANRRSMEHNFISYPFREEMVGDAIENCIMYIHNYKPEKYSNPFAYFSQIVWYAFLRRIQKEKTQMYTKFKLMDSVDWNAVHGSYANDSVNEVDIKHTHTDWSQEYINTFVTGFEEAKKRSADKKKTPKK